MHKSNYHNPFEREEWATPYDSWFDTSLGGTADRLQKRLVFRMAKPQAGESALDVGTGTGHYACALASRGLRVIGVDSSEAMLNVARAKGAPVVWQWGEAESLVFSDNTFDLVLSITALEFALDAPRALGEMFRVLRPGGRLVVGVLNADSPWGQVYMREARKHDTPFRYAHLYTHAEFLDLLGVHGRVRWSSSVFFAPSGRGLRIAPLLEGLGQMFCRGRGSLLVGRIDK